MKISLEWLKQYVPLTQTPEEIERALTMIGFEVEGILRTGLPPLDQVVVGEVLARDPHPNADRLSVCRVDIGPAGGEKTIVCGAQNYGVGDRVPVALAGAVLPGGFKIRSSKIRGVASDGMLCSARELGYAEDAEGLLVLDGRPPLGQPLNETLPESDFVFDIEVTPNRPDCLCHVGIARELAAYFDLDLIFPETSFDGRLPESTPATRLLQGVLVEAEEDCPLYTAHVIAGVRIGPSPEWLQRRLTAAGLRPINNIVDITNFVLLESGQPLHAFDARKIAGGKLIIRKAGDGEKLRTLDGKERLLSSLMLVIADTQRPLVIAGIMGGEDAEVDASTTDIILESAYFRPASVRWTSRRLGLSSDSSYRFERGIDPFGPLNGARRAVDLILSIAGGRLEGPVFSVGAQPVWENEIILRPDYVRSRAGYPIPDAAMKKALDALELPVANEKIDDDDRKVWTVAIPSFRIDLERPIDLVEEILRIYGTDKIPQAAVLSPGIPGGDDPVIEFTRKASAYLAGQHFNECVNYTTRSGAELEPWVSQAAARELGLANPFSEDQSHLRTTLLSGLLDNLRLNQSRQTGAARLFECGRVFKEAGGQVWECVAAAFIIANDERERRWLPRQPADFFTAKRHLEVLADLAGIDLKREAFGAVSPEKSAWQEGHSTSVGRITEGFEARVGLMSLAMLKTLGIEGTVLAGIIEVLPDRLRHPQARQRYRPFSLFPAALRDLALVVERTESAEAIRSRLEAVAREAAGERFQVEEVSVFDVYEGAGLPAGTKSLAFSLVFRAPDRTLTDDEVNEAFGRIQETVESATGYRIRK